MVLSMNKSLGPVMWGSKVSAAGGGYAQVLPMEDINLRYWNMHTITIHQQMPFLPWLTTHRGMSWKLINVYPLETRCGLRRPCAPPCWLLVLVVNWNGIPREDGIMYNTVTSEIMAILAWQRTSMTWNVVCEYRYWLSLWPYACFVGDLQVEVPGFDFEGML